MLGSEPIIRYEGSGVSAQCDLADEMAIRPCSSPSEPAAMDTKKRGPVMSPGRLGPPAGDLSHARGFKGHSLWDRHLLHHVVV